MDIHGIFRKTLGSLWDDVGVTLHSDQHSEAEVAAAVAAVRDPLSPLNRAYTKASIKFVTSNRLGSICIWALYM